MPVAELLEQAWLSAAAAAHSGAGCTVQAPGRAATAKACVGGPTTELDGPVHVVRWHGASQADMPQVVRADLLTRELELPYGEGYDFAEASECSNQPTAHGGRSSTTALPGPGRPTTGAFSRTRSGCWMGR